MLINHALFFLQPQEEITAPIESNTSNLENVSSASEPSELAAAGATSSPPSRDNFSSAPIDYCDVSNPNVSAN